MENNKERLFEMMEKVNPDYKQNFFNIALEELKKLNNRFHHLTDQELIDIANAEPMRFVELDSYPDSIYYDGIITDDLEFFEEEVEKESQSWHNFSVNGNIIKVNGKNYYYYIAGGD